MAINTFVPERDVIGRRSDGRGYLIASAGIPMTLDRARKLGLVKDEHEPPRPMETKPAPGPTETKSEPEINATDSAIELAGEHDINLTHVEGSGAGGRILKRDVEALI